MTTIIYIKNKNGDVIELSTTVPPTAARWVRDTDKIDSNGYIHRKTRKEAENDPIP